MDVSADQGSDVRIYEVWALSDDVEIKAAMPVGFQHGDVIGHLLTGPTWTPYALHLINDDD
ncbi:hypothetical protein SAMN05192589_12313 [Paracidovorax valerianellae]|uniref:Uncharacterized protein n=1 Tax=Paracidovorax valerianellae TaxID=187868 RepID=A0A1G7EG35_9BURK|nr:hypothetical protein SAMN05192589_12313 [Paracidovorax valerianellae]